MLGRRSIPCPSDEVAHRLGSAPEHDRVNIVELVWRQAKLAAHFADAKFEAAVSQNPNVSPLLEHGYQAMPIFGGDSHQRSIDLVLSVSQPSGFEHPPGGASRRDRPPRLRDADRLT